MHTSMSHHSIAVTDPQPGPLRPEMESKALGSERRSHEDPRPHRPRSAPLVAQEFGEIAEQFRRNGDALRNYSWKSKSVLMPRGTSCRCRTRHSFEPN